ncbi:MAG TPA: MarR family winged helix-turn-helix transcriptional regulator [Longimicrobiales bacterium]
MNRTVADRLHSLAIHLLRWARVEDAATGLSAARLSVLSVLVYGGARTVTELAEAEQVAAPTMTRLLQGLEADGYVRRRRDARDARVVQVTATARGRRALEAGRRARIRRIEMVLAQLDGRERADVAAVVSVLEESLGRAIAQSRDDG